ncbi:MAG: DUF3054 domain-containing protein [Caldilinea sp. CFX5]|nr:DUF3054 domain-containing protein [Caldilinea sp. CFX5]
MATPTRSGPRFTLRLIQILIRSKSKIAAPWLVLAWLLGAYPHQPLTGWRSVGRFLLRSALAWLFAAPLGLVLRAWIYQSPTIIMLFVNAALTSGGLFLLGWRSVYALIALFQHHKPSTSPGTAHSVLG